MVKDIDFVVSLSNKLFQFAQFSVITQVAAIKAAVQRRGATEVNKCTQNEPKISYKARGILVRVSVNFN